MSGREKERSYYCLTRKSEIIVRRRTFVSIIRATSIFLWMVLTSIANALLEATNYNHHYPARAIAAQNEIIKDEIICIKPWDRMLYKQDTEYRHIDTRQSAYFARIDDYILKMHEA